MLPSMTCKCAMRYQVENMLCAFRVCGLEVSHLHHNVKMPFATNSNVCKAHQRHP